MTDERMKVLTMLEQGKITATEAASLLEALNKSSRPEPVREMASHIGPILDKMGHMVDQIPEQVASEHLPKIGKGVGRVVENLSRFLNQGLGLLESHLQPTYNFEQTLGWEDLADITCLEVQNVHGTVRVIGEDRSNVSIQVVANIPGETQEAAQSYFANHPATLQREGGQLRLAAPTLLSTNKALGFFQRHRYDFECRVPRHLLPLVSNVSGDVHLDGLQFKGNGRIKTISGDLRVHGVSGDLDLNTVSGDIALDGMQGNADMKTVSGDLSLRDGVTSGSLSTVSGDIEVGARLSGELRLKTISGDIELRVETTYPISANSTSGDLNVQLLSGSSGYVDASTRSGDLQLGLALEEALLGKRHAKGKLAGGTAPISLSSVSGDIELR
ncbi:MAG TPA: DUF4097 family beta strand repeat-containing protein [Stenomitos sp.]